MCRARVGMRTGKKQQPPVNQTPSSVERTGGTGNAHRSSHAVRDAVTTAPAAYVSLPAQPPNRQSALASNLNAPSSALTGPSDQARQVRLPTMAVPSTSEGHGGSSFVAPRQLTIGGMEHKKKATRKRNRDPASIEHKHSDAQRSAATKAEPRQRSTARSSKRSRNQARNALPAGLDIPSGDSKLRDILARLIAAPAIARLMSDASPVNIRRDPDADTRFLAGQNGPGTIYVPSHPESDSHLAAALLFEAVNATNPHTYTRAAEAVLQQKSNQGVDLKTQDFIKTALEMEKDEFISLKRYADLVKSLPSRGLAKNILRDKYDGIFRSGETAAQAYKRYTDLNRRSGHTLELAQAQRDAYYGDNRGPRLQPPLEFRDPSSYDAYQRHQAGTGATSSSRRPSRRITSRIAEQIAEDRAAGRTMDATNMNADIARLGRTFDPSQV